MIFKCPRWHLPLKIVPLVLDQKRIFIKILSLCSAILFLPKSERSRWKDLAHTSRLSSDQPCLESVKLCLQRIFQMWRTGNSFLHNSLNYRRGTAKLTFPLIFLCFRSNKYLQKSSISRICAVGGFFISIPVFLTGKKRVLWLQIVSRLVCSI